VARRAARQLIVESATAYGMQTVAANRVFVLLLADAPADAPADAGRGVAAEAGVTPLAAAAAAAGAAGAALGETKGNDSALRRGPGCRTGCTGIAA
jgi:hypothetical protein